MNMNIVNLFLTNCRLLWSSWIRYYTLDFVMVQNPAQKLDSSHLIEL